MTLLIVLLLLGLIPAAIASSKGRNFLGWWIYGSALFIVALPHALVIGAGGTKRNCPYCAEPIQNAAIICPHCRCSVRQEPQRLGPIGRLIFRDR